MLYPSAEDLTKNHQSRYSLVIATAKIARKIALEAEANSIILNEKPVKTAVNMISRGQIVFTEKEDDYNTAIDFGSAARASYSADDSDGREDKEGNDD